MPSPMSETQYVLKHQAAKFKVKHAPTTWRPCHSHARKWLSGVLAAVVNNWIQHFLTWFPQLQQHRATSACGESRWSIAIKHKMNAQVHFVSRRGKTRVRLLYVCCICSNYLLVLHLVTDRKLKCKIETCELYTEAGMVSPAMHFTTSIPTRKHTPVHHLSKIVEV